MFLYGIPKDIVAAARKLYYNSKAVVQMNGKSSELKKKYFIPLEKCSSIRLLEFFIKKKVFLIWCSFLSFNENFRTILKNHYKKCDASNLFLNWSEYRILKRRRREEDFGFIYEMKRLESKKETARIFELYELETRHGQES
ncbi:hypothetical protein BpHYR1_045541 [Brachionus plicatilis]|uniref:Uncharacterized protein n=1 Tax=Brachionus plicatilis TaxID=10195 RepID=A0A3M7SXR6_BRAPC|nr:hypothetical protein BpHYR1_045541 [Brachionus plicatilis]